MTPRFEPPRENRIVQISQEDLEEPRIDVYQLYSMTGISMRRLYYYVQRGLVPKAIGSGPAARYNYGHVVRLKVIKILKDQNLTLAEIGFFFEAHTIFELLDIAEGAKPEGAISRMRRLYHRRMGEPRAGYDELIRVEIREGIELFVSDKYLPRAAARVEDLKQALDNVLEFED